MKKTKQTTTGILIHLPDAILPKLQKNAEKAGLSRKQHIETLVINSAKKLITDQFDAR
jgi:hypothetical protein